MLSPKALFFPSASSSVRLRWAGERSEVGENSPSPQKRLSFHSVALDTPARLIKQVAGTVNAKC